MAHPEIREYFRLVSEGNHFDWVSRVLIVTPVTAGVTMVYVLTVQTKIANVPSRLKLIMTHKLWITIWKCLNCGILDAENCKCNCPPGWDGIACQRPCDNLDQKCGADIEGISADLCPVYGGFWLSKVIFNFNSRGPQIGVVIHSFNRHG